MDRGNELRAIAKELRDKEGITPVDICKAARIGTTTLQKAFKKYSSLHPNTRNRLEEALSALSNRAKASA
jgi:DNA-binding LacI/PurR family transcriptional regulator